MASKGKAIAFNRRAVAAIPISAPEVLSNRRTIGRQEVIRTGRLLIALEQQEHDLQQVQQEANAQSKDDIILLQRQLTQSSTIVINVNRSNTQLMIIVLLLSKANSEASDEETTVEQSRS